jgi:hypothetical protein
MKFKIITIITLLVFSDMLFISCSKSGDTTTTANSNCDANTSFSTTILPLFNSSCNLSGCHDGPNAAQLNTYQVVHDNATQIRASISSGRMPKGGTLTNAQKNSIYCWIDNGAKNN